jgi:selenide, water dikinase
VVRYGDVPVLPGVRDLLAAGFKTGASPRNWAGYGESVELGAHGEDVKALLTDPQTSGGLLAACAPDTVMDVLSIFRAEGFGDAAVIGEIVSGPARVTVR